MNLVNKFAAIPATVLMLSLVGDRPAMNAAGLVPNHLCRDGYRIHGEISDAVVGRRWLVMENCSRPQGPWKAVPGLQAIETGGGSRVSTQALAEFMVRAGSRVHLIKSEANVRLNLAGVALESGAAGDHIRVRVSAQGTVLSGIVRTHDLIELAPPGIGRVAGGMQ